MNKKSAEPTSFTKDRPVMLLAVADSALALLAALIVFARLRSHDFKVPVQYLARDGSVLSSSSWYTLYSLAIFSLVGAGVSVFLAHKLYKGNRLFAGGILAAYLVVGVVSVLTINALLGLVARV